MILYCRKRSPLGGHMRRRDFITLVGVAAAILPFKAYAQRANKLPKVGSLQSSRNENFDAFIEGLREAGYIDHQNVEMEHRFYQGAMDRMEGFANARRSPHWLLAIVSLPCIRSVSLPKSAACCPTEPTRSLSFGVRRHMLIASSRERNRASFPFRRQSISIWSSTLRPPKRWASPCHLAY